MAKAIMIQGTMSNAGKSLITAGLCRIFHQDGYRVAPFKSQNMALNSFITDEGLEMGRAQVMQAQASCIAPSARMNPVLLKPTSDTGSQVIVNGRVIGNYSAREYFAFKKELVPEIMRAYESLAAENDIIVIEGAGSPAEINLKDDDIVNMGMARLALSPVLLTGDIDRGGVFAQLYGTVFLLEQEEREMVKGLIINKFRGDKTILDPGVRMLEELTHIPVTGVVPYIRIDIDDEDSLTDRFDRVNPVLEHNKSELIDVAVIRLPHISNFTDFNPLTLIDGVSLRYVDSPARLGSPDMIIIPGSKNTMGDLKWMRQRGLEAAILKAAAIGVNRDGSDVGIVNKDGNDIILMNGEGNDIGIIDHGASCHAHRGEVEEGDRKHRDGSVIFGICGGYQMLGETLSDPEGVEEGGIMRGMGLLPVDTFFAGTKTRARITGTISSSNGIFREMKGTELEGYEIHMGISSIREGQGAEALAVIKDLSSHVGEGRKDGAVKGNVCGSYVHGFFDRGSIANGIVEALCRIKGLSLSSRTEFNLDEYRNSQYDKLASTLRDNMDIEHIYRILEKGLRG